MEKSLKIQQIPSVSVDDLLKEAKRMMPEKMVSAEVNTQNSEVTDTKQHFLHDLPSTNSRTARKEFPKIFEYAQHAPQIIENKRNHKKVVIMSPEVVMYLIQRATNPVRALLDNFAAEPLKGVKVTVDRDYEAEPDVELKIRPRDASLSS